MKQRKKQYRVQTGLQGVYKVYMVYEDDDFITSPVYIGLTKRSVTERMAGHIKTSGGNLPFAMWLRNHNHVNVYVDNWYDSKKLGRKRERELIELFDPVFNNEK